MQQFEALLGLIGLLVASLLVLFDQERRRFVSGARDELLPAVNDLLVYL